MPFLRILPVMALALATVDAHAAVRRCTGILAFAGEDKESKSAAKLKAMAGWTAAAAKFGPAYVLWRNAADKSLSCMKLADGHWRCQAYGRACGVSQVPGNLPPNSQRPSPSDTPNTKGLPI